MNVYLFGPIFRQTSFSQSYLLEMALNWTVFIFLVPRNNSWSSSLQRATKAATPLHRSSNLVASWGSCRRLAPLLSVLMLQAGFTRGTGIMGARLDTGPGKRMTLILEVASSMFPLQIKIIHIPTWYSTGLGQSIGHTEQCWTVNVGHRQVAGLLWLDKRDAVDKIHQFTCTRPHIRTFSRLLKSQQLSFMVSLSIATLFCVRLCHPKWPLVQACLVNGHLYSGQSEQM